MVPRNIWAQTLMPASRSDANNAEMTRSFLFVSAFQPGAARNAVLESPFEVELVAITPSPVARQTADHAVSHRQVRTVEHPLLAAGTPSEIGSQVLVRLAQVLRELDVYEARAVLVVIEGLDVLGASVFTVDKPEPAPLSPGPERRSAFS